MWILLKICHCVLYSIVYIVATYVIGNITLHDNDIYKMMLVWIVIFTRIQKQSVK